MLAPPAGSRLTVQSSGSDYTVPQGNPQVLVQQFFFQFNTGGSYKCLLDPSALHRHLQRNPIQQRDKVVLQLWEWGRFVYIKVVLFNTLKLERVLHTKQPYSSAYYSKNILCLVTNIKICILTLNMLSFLASSSVQLATWISGWLPFSQDVLFLPL